MADSDVTKEDWDEIHGFSTPGEYQRFETWVGEALEEGVLAEIEVDVPYSGSSMFYERWFRSASGQVWRLVAPDPPFRGVFEQVRR